MKHRIRNKIVVPYLVLALLVAILGAFVAFFIIAGSLQDRLEQQLRQSALHTSQGLVDFEDQQLGKLRMIALSGPDAEEGQLSTVQALRRADRSQLAAILRNALDYYQMNHLLAFDLQGAVLAEQHTASPRSLLPSLEGASLSSLTGVRYIINRQQDIIDGKLADKFTSLLLLPTSDGDNISLLYTVVPVRQRDPATGEERLVGGILASEPLQSVVATLHQGNGAFYTVLYDSSGQVLASNSPGNSAELAMPSETLQLLRQQSNSEHALRTLPVNKREFLFAYSPLRIRERIDGYFAVAVEVNTFFDSWQPTRNAILGLTLLMLTAVVGLGHSIARRITLPLQELAQTATAIAQGQLSQRSRVRSSDEVGTLANVINEMADQLVDLYHASRALSAELDVAGIIRATDQAVQRLLPGTTAAAIVPHDGGWMLVADGRAPAYLTWFDIEGVRRLAAFGTADMLHAVASTAELDAIKPRWVLPLQSRNETVGLLLIAGGAAELAEQRVSEPLVAIASMAATSLKNALLYARVEQDASKNRAILESIADGVIVCDPDDRIVLANDVAATLLAQPAAQLYGLRFSQLPLTSIQQSPELFAADAGQQQVLYEANQRALSLSISPVVHSDGSPLGNVVILHDVTAQRQIDRAKTDFIATISHELRTPLTPIQGYLDLLLQPEIGGELNEDQHLFVQTIRENVDAMSCLLNNVILLARLESGNLPPRQLAVPVPAAVEDALDAVRSRFAKKGLQLIVNVAEHTAEIRGDPHHIHMALVELLENACQFTSEGSITLSATDLDTSIQIDIADTGCGISLEDQQRLFTRFSRGGEQSGLVATERGAGLGLAIARRLIEQQRGTISVVSEVGRGSVFSVRLPSMSAANETAELAAIKAAMARQ